MQALFKYKDSLITVILLFGPIIASKLYSLREEISSESSPKSILKKLKQQIDKKNPSLQSCKQVMQLCIKQTKQKVIEYSAEFTKKRQHFTKHTRKQDFHNYITTICEGIKCKKNIAVQTHLNILQEIGITQLQIRQHGQHLDKYVEQVINQETRSDLVMTCEQAKIALRKQIQFINKDGLEYTDLIVQEVKMWSEEDKALLPDLISILVNDCAFEDYPVDIDSLERAEEQYIKQLMAEMQDLQVAMVPMMMKLNSVSQSVILQ